MLLIHSVINSRGLYFQYRHISFHSMSFLDILKVYTNNYNIRLHYITIASVDVDLQHIFTY